jgi:hypothetical protein
MVEKCEIKKFRMQNAEFRMMNETACGFAGILLLEWAVNCPPLDAHCPLF